jgi:modulator of FtsH protease
MELYKRDYAKPKTQTNERTTFIQQTYQLFAGSLLIGAIAAYYGMSIPAIKEYYWGLVILEFALIFGIGFARGKQGLNLFLLMAFALVSGLTMSVIVERYLGSGNIVTNAIMLTTVAFGSLSIFAMNTKRDFSYMGKMLFISLIVIIVASLINIFFIHNSLIQVGISAISAIVFSGYILYDTQNIMNGRYDSPVDGALSLYISFINLFQSILHLLGFVSEE